MSIVTRVFLLIAFTLLLVACGELFNGLNLRQKRLEEFRGDTIQLARIGQLDMARILEGTRQLLATLARLSAKHGWDERACSVLEATASSDFEYDHLVAVDRSGIIRCSSSGTVRVGVPMPEHDLIERIVATNSFSVGSYGIGLASGNEVIRVGYPIVDEAGVVIGGVYAGINVTWLNTALSEWKLGENVTINITDRNGILLARHPDTRQVGQPIPDSLKTFLAGTDIGVVEAKGLDGVTRLFGYVPVRASPDGLAVFVGQGLGQVFADINRLIWLNAAVVLIALSLSAIFTIISVRRFLARPFNNLLTAVGRWRDGDWEARSGAASGIPEFDRLAFAFDGMAAEVAARGQALHQRDVIMEAITKGTSELVAGGPIAKGLPRLLQTVGEALQADRVLVLEAQPMGSNLKLVHAWHGPSSIAEVHPDFFGTLPNVPPPEIAAWLRPLSHGEIVAVTRRKVAGAVGEVFDAFHIASNLQAPIQVDGAQFGQLSIDDCKVERTWSATEIHAVRLLADFIGAAIARERHLRKLAEADAVVRSSPAIVFRMSTANLPPHLTYISDNVSLLGANAAELLANPGLYLTLIHPDDRGHLNAALTAAARGAPSGTSIDLRIADASGSYHWIECRYTPVHGAAGQLVEVAGVMLDVSDRKAAEAKLQFANTLLTTLRDTSPDAILVVGSGRVIISVNQKFLDMWRLPPDVTEGTSDVGVLDAVAASVKDKDAFLTRIQYLHEHPGPAQDEVATADGRFLDRRTDVLRAPDGRSLGRVWFFRDVTDRKLAEAKITQMARYDILTGLANRGVFVEALQQAIAWAYRNDSGFAVVYLDLDHFKDVNDTLGHPIGDLLLQEMGRRLQASVRATDTVSRFGGDEFAIILVDIRGPEDAALLADKIMKAIGRPYSIQGNVIRSGASVGIAVYGLDSLDAESLLSHADVALYRSKSEGRGTYRFFTDAMDAEVRTRVTMGAELYEAIAQQQFFLLYQPQVEIETGRIVGLEALVRWRHPKRGIVGPSEFIAVAEKSGHIVALGQWVMRETCRQTKRWLDAGIAPPSVAFNVSGSQFRTAHELEHNITAVLAETGVPPHMLELELTESVLMDASHQHNDVLIRIRGLGLRIALDDFGTGYSSLDYLRRFPVDRIKIAQDFIPDLGGSENTAIVRAAISLAGALGIEVIVEGVETDAQLALLKAWGCRYVQGYYFAKPLSVLDATSLLRAGKIVRPHVDPVIVPTAA